MTINKRIDALLNDICPPVDKVLAESLLHEFLDIERRYILGDWEPTALNGGQFAEIASRIIYHIDSNNINRKKSVNDCLTYIEDITNSNPHSFPQRRTALHICRVIRTIYKFRSQRGAIHIDPDYTANELDSALIISLGRWLMSEILRIFWSGKSEEVSQIIREIVRYEVPAIINIDERQLVLHTGCSVEEEVLLLLHNAGETGLSRTNIGKSIPKPAQRISDALKSLISANKREIVQMDNKMYVLTPNGTRRIHNELSDKLTLATCEFIDT